MKANMKAFGKTDPFGARITLKENLNEVKDHSEVLLKSMDALIGRIQFEKQQEQQEQQRRYRAVLDQQD